VVNFITIRSAFITIRSAFNRFRSSDDDAHVNVDQSYHPATMMETSTSIWLMIRGWCMYQQSEVVVCTNGAGQRVIRRFWWQHQHQPNIISGGMSCPSPPLLSLIRWYCLVHHYRTWLWSGGDVLSITIAFKLDPAVMSCPSLSCLCYIFPIVLLLSSPPLMVDNVNFY
jgi:hypothetical protein